MTAVSQAPFLKFRGFDNTGNPLVGGKLFTYAAGTTTKLATYTDSTGATPNANPIILDSRGECDLFFISADLYKLTLSPSTDTDPPTSPFWTEDNISPIGSAVTITNLASSSGSSMIGFIQGGTGAVATTVQAKERKIINIADFGAVQDGSTDDTTAFQNAINYAATFSSTLDGGAVVEVNATASGTYIGSTLTVPSNIRISGKGSFVKIIYGGSGNLFSSAGTSMATLSYVAYENLFLTSNSRHVGAAINFAYTNVVSLTRVRMNEFQYGLVLSNSTGCSLFGCAFYDDQYGVEVGTASGGFNSYGTAWDSCQLNVLINGESTGVHFFGDQFDTDENGLNGAGSQGAVSISAAVSNVGFQNCSFFAEAVPTLGATVSVSGSCSDILFNNCFFLAAVGSVPAAIKIDSASSVHVIGGSTSGHSTSSYIQTSNATNVLALNTRNLEGATITGTGLANFNQVSTGAGNVVFNGIVIANGGFIARGGSPFQINSSNNAANVEIAYSGGDVFMSVATAQGIKLNGTRITQYTAPPNGAINGSPGDICLNTAGGSATTLYVKESGTNTQTGWVGK